ncbi:MAG TPA: sugar ABC transporter substrate-binding protein [Gaiellaceae bacterium]|nr:sugar ABC transporter substrate-binding protein [Gaiellaceae bacterium]
MRRRLLAILGVAAAAAIIAGAGSSAQSASAAKHAQLVFGYISPGPDTWYQRDVDGFKYAAARYGVKVVVLNSQYDQQKELANIQSLVNQGVDGISMFSFNTTGAIKAAQAGLKAHIPVVLTDDVGHAIASGAKVAAAVDFDWCGMGKSYAQWMAKNYPGEPYVLLAGNFQAPPTQILDRCMINTAKQLGKNKLAALKQTNYNPATAVTLAQNLVTSGTKFKVIFVMDEDMAAAVARMLQGKGLLNNPYVVIAQNGSPVGIEMLEAGTLKYTISSSPGWEGTMAFLALRKAVLGKASATANTRLVLPVMPITPQNVTDPTKVVPWEPGPVYWTLTKKYYPSYLK